MGGAEKQLLNLTELLSKRDDFYITIVSRKTSDELLFEEISNNVKIQRIKTINIPLLSMILFMLKLFFRILRINKKKKIDLIHLPLPDIYIIALRFIRRLINVPVITRVAGDELSPFRKKGLWYLNRILVRRNMLKLDGIQVLNPMAKDEALKLGFPKEKLFLIPNGVKIPLNTRSYDKLTNTLLYVGAMRFFPRKQKIEQKNLIFLIESFTLLLEKRTELSLIMVGDGNYRSIVENKVKSLKLDKKVIFKGYQTDIVPYLHSADIFINPSRYEGLPNTVLEAMSYGVYTLCSNIPEHQYLIGNNEYGDLFDYEKESSFILKVEEFYQNTDVYIEKAHKAQEHIKENFSIESTLRSLLKMYDVIFTKKEKSGSK